MRGHGFGDNLDMDTTQRISGQYCSETTTMWPTLDPQPARSLEVGELLHVVTPTVDKHDTDEDGEEIMGGRQRMNAGKRKRSSLSCCSYQPRASAATIAVLILPFLGDTPAVVSASLTVPDCRTFNKSPLCHPPVDLFALRGGVYDEKFEGDRASDEDEDEEENARLDAYIEDLLASVDDSSTGESSTADHDDDDEEEAIHGLENSEKATVSPPDSSLTIETTKRKKKRKKSSGREQSSSSTTKQMAVTNTREAEVPSNTESVSSASESIEATVCDGEEIENGQLSTPDDNETAEEDNTKPEYEPAPETIRKQSQVVMTMPNPLFRFLLNRGRIGHVIVMMLALILDWLAVYLPLVSSTMDWVYVRVVPKRMRELPRRRGGREGPSGPVPPTVVTTAMARTGASKKKQRVMIREADKVALQQLKSLGSNSRFRHVSLNFMKRYALGPYGRGEGRHEFEEGEDDSVSSSEDASSSPKVTQTVKEARRRKKSTSASSSEEPEDWVVRALTADHKSCGGQSKVRPTVSLQLRSNGVGVSFGLETGPRRKATLDKYRESVTLAVAQQKASPHVSKRVRKPAGERSSDASSGFIGKIRASGLSRSLLGAYPGDAVPVEDAADSEGLIALAKRYGYEDRTRSLSESGQDDFFAGFSDESSFGEQRKKRKLRRKQVSDDDRLLGGGHRRDTTVGRNTAPTHIGISLGSGLSRRTASARTKLDRLDEVRSSSPRTEKKIQVREPSIARISKTIPRSTAGSPRALDRIKELKEREGDKSSE
mmetsp:Transcript_10404/g.28751  ORF Transcript_10404/g.28751 Transcript_10404/m.28751 type:complete len:772 (+) Transcript_10404:34-2349(+)